MPTCSCCNNTADSHKIIACCICNRPYKIECVNVTTAEARRVHQKTGFTWSCSNCQKLGDDLNALKSVIVALQEEVKSLKSMSFQQTDSLLESEKIIQEISERDKRKSNVILYGCDESDCTSNNVQVELDVVMVKEVCSLLQITDDSLKVSRLGKFDSTQTRRRRPIKVSFQTESHVITALRNLPNLKSTSRFSGISVYRDRTPMQLQIHRNAKAELTKRLENGEENLKIKYNRGIPTVVSSLNQ